LVLSQIHWGWGGLSFLKLGVQKLWKDSKTFFFSFEHYKNTLKFYDKFEAYSIMSDELSSLCHMW
jgi:hypothetical protein